MQYPYGGAHRPVQEDGVWTRGVAEQICLLVQCLLCADASLNSVAGDLQYYFSIVPSPCLERKKLLIVK